MVHICCGGHCKMNERNEEKLKTINQLKMIIYQSENHGHAGMNLVKKKKKKKKYRPSFQ